MHCTKNAITAVTIYNSLSYLTIMRIQSGQLEHGIICEVNGKKNTLMDKRETDITCANETKENGRKEGRKETDEKMLI